MITTTRLYHALAKLYTNGWKVKIIEAPNFYEIYCRHQKSGRTCSASGDSFLYVFGIVYKEALDESITWRSVKTEREFDPSIL
jgi:hypothetical protein